MSAATETREITVEHGDHVVQFYEHDSELLAAVAPYLIAAARAGEVAIVIATESHRRAFDAELEAGGIDPAAARADGTLFSLDAATTLVAFMSDGQIDREAFHEVIGGVVRTAAESGRAVRAYGEMVALLWDAGDVLAAIELETLWNELARELPFSLFCSYPAASVASSEHADALHQVCHLHSSVVRPSAERPESAEHRLPENGVAATFPAERDSPARARRLVVAALRRWGHDVAVVDDAALVLSELASNAVLHARSPFTIIVGVKDSTLRVGVEDLTPLAATRRDGGLSPRPAHGLAVIAALSRCWGVEATPDGKLVWAELAV